MCTSLVKNWYLPNLNWCSGTTFLADEWLVYVGDDTAAGDGGLDEAVQLLVSSDGELQVPGGDALHFEILRRVTGQLQYLFIILN